MQIFNKRALQRAFMAMLIVITGGSTMAQDNIELAASVQGGPNVFFGNAYPNDIVSYSFGATLDMKFSKAIGGLVKLETGSLTGSNVLGSGDLIFDASVNYGLLGTAMYLDPISLIWGESDTRFVTIKGFAGIALMNGRYIHSNIKEDYRHKYVYGTENPSNTLFPVFGGGIFEFRINSQLKAIVELAGFIEYTDKLDGVAYGAVYQDSYELFDPGSWKFRSYKEEYDRTGVHPDPKPLGWFDNFATFEFGIKYTFGRATGGGGGSKKVSHPRTDKKLPGAIRDYHGADGMEKGGF